MRSIWRTLTPSLQRDTLAMAGAIAVVGVSFGAIAVASGMDWWIPSALSVLVFAGGSQFMVVGVVAAGGGLVAAVAGALLLNARHLPFGLALGDIMGRRPLARIVGSHLLIDESVAFAMAQKNDSARARAVFWFLGTTAFVVWNLGTIVGAAAGQVIGDTDAYGLDAAFPAALLALVLPALKNARTRNVALLGAVVSLATTPFLPAGVPVLLSLAGLVVLVPAPKKNEEVAA
ncbi:AzlC family ABC transporter permease [Actinophytocola algeriensis]|uniref:4-azaleucine resistance transporter AzlC n=1 Tax=Actinophytocola algeriensis TaxID=1768010 RepID=A0A7W7Q950_9PSEU|nr:AzlC family ABC transporter permease [Actinophytocola algeriensis]MBB4908906.1 4-azaleucine resistance transporter AzlC [Actinophytocola algeriensis]MBE1474706.1 4-azaleucine resistance transporter AzlC [Actinophytocola algeriensis]